MKWYDGGGKLIYGPKTSRAFGMCVGYTDWPDVPVNRFYYPLLIAHCIDQHNLMTPEIRKELEDYIFVDV